MLDEQRCDTLLDVLIDAVAEHRGVALVDRGTNGDQHRRCDSGRTGEEVDMSHGPSDATGSDPLERVAAEDGAIVTDQEDRYGTSDDEGAIDAAGGGPTEEGGDVLRQGPAGVAGVGGADGLPGGTEDGDAVGRTGARTDEPERGEDVAAV